MKTAILFGASGNVGSHLLNLLLDSEEYDQVKIVVRKPLIIQNHKLVSIIGSYNTLAGVKEQLNANDVFIILGATDKNVERNYPVLIARLCKEQGAQTISIVTAAGANPKSSISFTKLKGEIEQDVLNLHYNQTHIFRPGMIMGERTLYRPMEKTMVRIWKIINPLLIGKLSKYKGIQARNIAQAMLLNTISNKEVANVFHWKEMKDIIKEEKK